MFNKVFGASSGNGFEKNVGGKGELDMNEEIQELKKEIQDLSL